MTGQDKSFPLDLKQIAALARGRGPTERVQFIITLNDNLGGRVDGGPARDRQLFTAFLDELLAAIEQDVRARLADQLAAHPDAPRPLIALLANQDIEIARPVLTSSRTLRDDDLIDIIRQRTLEHQVAIAQRSDVSEAVSEELVGTGQTRVIVTLLRNASASVRQETLAYLAEQAERVNAFREPLSRRSDLPEPVARRMYRLVSGAIREEIAKRFDFDVSVLDDDIEAVLKQATDALHSTRGTPTMARALASELTRAERFDPQQMVELLRRGEMAAFESMLMQQSGLRPADLREVVYEAGGEAFAVICRAVGMSAAMFAEAHDLTRRAGGRQDQQVAEELRGRTLALFDRLEPEAAAAMVATWRNDRAAIHDLCRPGRRPSNVAA